MGNERPTDVKLPATEAARQATDALGGYVYQLDHTVMTWLTLGEDEALHIEFAEDVAVSAEGTLELVQIKKVAANITLRSDGVAKLISSVWRFQQENPDRRVSGALLTTSAIGKEKKMQFPGNLPGLSYWRTAAREGADVEPIRAALLSLAILEDLQKFVGSATADELRARVIRPIHWLENKSSQDELRRDVEEQLVLLGSHMGVSAAASKDARHFLVGALLDSISKPARQRFVTRADLLEIFQKKTFVTVPPDVFQGLSLGGTVALTPVEATSRNVAEIPLARRVASRDDEVARLHVSLVSGGTLWLHGSSGLGKSTLAILLARSQRTTWQLVDLREVSSPVARSILIGIANAFRRTGARGLILDDFQADADNALISALGQVARAVADADGLLIITCAKPPHPTLRSRLELPGTAIVDVPYLEESDVATMVVAAGGDPKQWARSIFVFSGGHPQLADARVAGVAQRGWNQGELLADFVPLKGVPNDIDEERKAVRSRLLQELPSNATELLLRLSLLHGNFDRTIAQVAAETPVAISTAGIVFDFLVGPWIEQVGRDRYRLSPLLRDSGAAGLSQSLQVSIKTSVLNYLTRLRPFPADQLLQVFLIAFQQDHRAGLTWFAHAILGASARGRDEQFKRLAQEVSVFALVDRGDGKSLISGDVGLSTMLRFAQLRVAAANGDMTQAKKLVDRCLWENEQHGADARLNFDAMIYVTVMLEPRIPIGPTRWLPMLLELQSTPLIRSTVAKPVPADDSFGGLPATVTYDEIMFIVRAGALTSIEGLAELIGALEQQPKAVRDRYLSAAARAYQSLHLIVSSSWLTEVKQPDFDPRAAATAYRRLTGSRCATESADLDIELRCAEAIMLDEYASDKDGALDVLRVAQEAYPNDYRLNRQRQKVFYRHNQHVDALLEFEKFKERLPKEFAVDRAFAMREAGRSAANVGELGRARMFFEQAWESARICGPSMKPMTAGLSADCAILDFDAGRTESALALMCRSLEESENLDPNAGLKEAFIKRVQMAAILYMRGAAADFPAPRQAVVYGMCSEPEPQEWFRNQPQPQPQFVWYQLAELEAEISPGQTVLAELRKRTMAGGLLPLETMLVSHLASAAIRERNIDRFLDTLKTFPRAATEGLRNLQSWGGGDLFNMPVGSLVPISEVEWSEPRIAEATKHAVLSFMLACGAAGEEEVMAEFRTKAVDIPGLAELVRPLFAVMDEPSQVQDDTYVEIASIVGRLLKGEILDTNEAFSSSIYAFQFLENSTLAAGAAAALMSFYERLWPEILNKRAFSMRSPATNGPIILQSLHKGKTAMQRMANMLLATAAASRYNLGQELRDRLSKFANKRFQPESSVAE